jgi:hypothetical protein
MTSLLLVLLGIVVVALVVAVLVNGRMSPLDSSSPASSPWFERARQILDHADRLTAIPQHVPGGRLGTLDEGQLRSISEQFVELSGEIAALSATAPTSMDARVSRGLGIQSRLVGELFDRELRRREVFVDDAGVQGDRPESDQVADRLREFELAVDDLRTHVDLL